MNKITLKTSKIIFFILFLLASLNSYSQTPIFSNPTLKSGTANSVGAKYLYTGVTTVDGTSVDAVVTIVSITNAVVVEIDNPNNGGGGLLNRFQPVIRSTVSGGNVEFDFTFYKSGTYGTALELKIDLSSFTIETLDIDGGEFFDIVIPTNASYTLESPTEIIVSTVSPYTRFTGPNESVDPISITNTAYIASVSYGRVNSVKFRLGSTYELNDRQSSISFGEVTYDIPKAPVTNDDSKLNQTNGPVSIDVTLNDTDANHNINKSTIDLNPSTSGVQTKLTVANEGEWKVDSNGIVTFTPLITFIGNPTPITYVLKDLTNLTSNIATITITYIITLPLDTDTDGIINNIDLDDDNDGITDGNEGCNFTSVLANPTDAIVNSLNTSGTGLFPLDPFGPAVLPQSGVNVSVISGFSTSSQQWRIYQPTVINASISIQGNPTNFATKYLDLIGAYNTPKVLERTVKLDYQVTSKSLNSGNYKYRYIIGIAGLSDPNVAGKITSSVPLEVIGNVDVFNTGKYSYFDGSTPPVEGQVGTIMASNPLIANSVAPPNGYTFYYLPDDITSFNLRTEGNDQYGFIFGALTLLCDDTDGDSTPNALDYDSDNDECSDANEAYSSINADTNGDGTYSGVVGIAQVNNNGLVIAAGINSTGKNYNTTPSPNVKIATKITSSTNPVDTFTTVGQSATFSVTATAASTTTFSSGTPNYTIPPATDSSSSLTYQWQVNTGSNWANISSGGTNPLYANTTTATLSISQVTTNMKGYQYRVLIKHLNNVCASVTSNSASLSCVNPLAPTASDQTVCSDGSTTQTLTATATGGTITWYDAATAGNLIASPTQVGVGTKTYYAQASNNNCSSSTRTPVKLTINAVPAAPTASNQTVCSDGTTTQTLTATATGGTITWYDAATAGNVVSSPTQVGVGTKTYYAQAYNGTCSSLTRTAVKLTINVAPAAPTATNQTVCSDGTTTQTLTATATGGTITWYDAATAGNLVSSPTQVGVGTKTYYAQANNGTCSSLTRTAVKLTINVAPAAPTASNQTVCTDGTTTQTLTATATGGTITWYDAATAGNVVSSPTQVGIGTKTYYAQSSNGTCSSITRTAVKLTINPLPGTPNANNVEYCQGDIPQALTATASNPANNLYYFSSLNSTPQTVLTPSTSTAGQFTYYVAEESNSCLGPKKAITVLINPKAVITNQPVDKNIIYGNNTSFSVVATNVTTYQWQVNNGTGYTNITNNSIYSNATTATLTIANPTVAMSNYKYRALLTGTCINTTTDPATLTVTPKVLNVTVVADDQTKVYGDLNPALTAVVTGAVNGDTINYTLATTATQFSNVGDYPIAVTLGANPNYTVVATDATLTVTPKVLNVTVVADDQTKVYGDLNPTLTAVVTGAVNGDTINYTLATTATQFSNVGDYPIAVTLGANPNYTVVATDATLTVTPKVLNVTVVADDQTKVYGDLNPALTAVVTGAVNGDTINYTLATTATQFSNVGAYPIAVTLGANPNYTVVATDATLTVTPKVLNVTVVADDQTKVYGDLNPALTAVVTGAVNGDTINYTLATTATQFSNVGDYPIAVTLGANPNYTVVATDATLTVTPKVLNVTVVADDQTKVYGDLNPTLTAVVTGAVNGDTINYTLATTATQFSNVGDYPIAVTLGANPNYTVVATDATLTVTPKVLNVTVVADDQTKVYGDLNPALTAVVTGAVNGDTINYTLATTATQFSNVGAYPIAVTLGANPNYTVVATDATLTVTPKVLNVTVVADDQTKVYGDLNPALTAIVSGAVNGDTINYTLATTATQFSNVGDYPIAVTLGANPNYTVVATDATLTVTPKVLNVTVVADDQTKVYGDLNPTLTAIVSGAVNGDTINYTLATTATQFSNVGAYPIAVTLGANPNYTVVATDATLTVSPKVLNVTVVADDQTKVYGDLNPTLTAVVTGAVNGDTINYTLATTATQFSNVGDYPIAVTLGANPNYTVVATDATLTVTPKVLNVTVVADDQTKVYGDLNPALTAVVTGAVNGDTINYTLATTATQFSNVGDYPIAVTLGANPNYTVVATDATLTVTPKVLNVTVVADDQTKVYGDLNPALTAVVTGAVNGDTINYTLATTATQFSNVGDYPIAVTLGANPNYTVVATDATLTVTPKVLNVTVVADDQTKVYGDLNPALTAVVSGAVNGDTINYTLATTATQFSNVGDYPIAVTLGANPNYTVVATDATLTVTPKVLNVTVVADDQTKVYGDLNPALTAVVTGAVNGDTINYTLATTATQFSNVGDYPIAVTLGANPNYTVVATDATLTVTPKVLNVTVVADDQTKVYGDLNPALTAVVTGAVNGDTINYTLATTATQFSNVGDYPIAVTLGANPNYTVVATDATLTVTPKVLNVTVVADDQTKVYGDLNPALTAVVTGAVNGDTINYTLATTATQFSNVGAYPIAVTLGANPNYTVVATDATLTVTPKVLNVTVVADDQTKVYGDLNPALTAVVTGAVNGDTINYTLATTATQFSNVGDYPIAVTLGANPNYTVVATDATLTVTPKVLNVTVVADDQTKVYGDLNPTLTAVVTGAVNGDTINYTLATTATQFSNVGDYPIAVTLGANPNYTVVATDATLTVTPKVLNVTVVADDQTKVYGDLNPALTAVVSGAVNGDTINYTLATTATQFSNVGDYPIAVTLGANPNYTVVATDATLTVTPKVLNVTVVADDQTKVYGDLNPALTAVVTGAVNGDTINYTLATTATQFSNVGDYPIAVTLGANPNYTVVATDATLTVTPKVLNVTVVADDQTKVYGDLNPALTAVVTGAVNGDTINYTLATTATQFSNVGDYPIAVTLGANPNYTVVATDATLTVTPKVLNVTVVADDQTKVYGDLNPALTAVVTGAVNGDTINYTLATTATQFSNVGAYPIAVTLGANPNYTVVATDATLTVTPKVLNVTVVADDQTKVYGDLNPALTAVVTGAVNGDTINYTLATTATQFSNVGDYPIAVTLGANPNYTVVATDATLTVTPKVLNVTVVADDQTKVYGDLNPTLTAVVTGAVNGDTINYTLATTATQFSNVGDYPIAVTLGANPNYTVVATDATLTVTPKVLNVTVVADDQTKVYGDLNPALTAVVTGAVNGDTINYTLATTATQFSNVGAYPIAVTLGANPNYTVVATDATLTVTPKVLNVTVVADDQTKVYGDLNPALTAIVSGAVNGDTINYTLATTATQFSNVGDYPIAVTLGANPNYTVVATDATLTVTPKVLNVTVVADDQTKVYGDLNPTLTAIVSGAVNGDTINYTLATTATQFSNVGAYPIAVTLGANPNYTVVATDATLTVSPKVLNVTVVADDQTKVYGDLNPTLTAVVTGAVNGDTINYTLATTATQFSNVGDYPIAVTLGANPNYTVVATDATLTVTPKVLNVTVVADDQTKVYGDLNPALTAVVTGAVNGDTINYTLATTATQFSNVGDYPIAVTLGANPNYTVVATDATLTVTPKVLNVTVVADDQTKVYGDLNPALTAVVTGAVNGDTINYTLATTATQFSNVGAYPIAVTLGANPNYTVVATDATLTVTPKVLNVTVVADDQTKVYGDLNPALTAVVSGAVNGDTINYTLATTATQFSNVGDYPIAVTLGANPNYTVVATDATLTVTPKVLNVTVVADDQTKVYGDLNPALTAVVTGAVNGDTINYTLATTATQFSNVGDYPIAVTLGANPNYTVVATDATLTVTPKVLNVTVVADDQTKVYGDLNPALTAVVTGAVNGDTINYTLATTATQFSNVGDYPIAVTLGANPNYTVVATDATLTVTPKVLNVTVVADDQTKVYGDLNPALTAVVTGAVNGDTINYTLATTATQFSNVGAYPIAVTLGANPNYTVVATDATLTVTPKVLNVTVVADDQTKVYGDLNPALTAVVTGAVNGDTINYTLATTATQFSNVGDYPIAVTLGANPNYTVVATDATLTVTPKVLNVTVVADDQTKVYGDLNPTLTAVVTGAVNGDTINYTLATTATQFSNVGDYPIAVTLGANPNYTVVATDATLTVTPKVLNVTVVADDQTKVYGDLNPALTAVVTGAVNGDTINYTLATTATQFSNVGAYPIAVTLGANPNYTVVATDATLTVTPKVLNVTVVADDQTKVYGDLNPALTAIVSGAVNGDTINYTLATTATQFSNVGDYPIAVTLGANPNYTVVATDATLTVTPKVLNVTVVADDQTKVYGDLNPTLTAVVTGAVNGDTINYTLATTATQFSNVGDYPIAVTLGANPNYTVVATDATLTVTPKVLNVTVVADDQTKVYGDLNPTLTAIVSGAVNGDTINYTLATTATQFSNVGAYPIAVTLGANPNYTVVATDATLTVSPKVLNVTVVADDQTKVYGDLNPTLTAVVTGAVNGDTINYTLATTATQFSNVGDYPIAVTLGANPNYTVVATDATLTVTPKVLNVTVVADDQTKVYGDLNPALTAVVTGAVNGDTINYTLATTATQFSNVGDYPIAVTLGANPNYTVVATDATLTVTPKVLNVTVVADDQTKVYGDLNPTLTAVVTGAVNGDTINYTLATTATQFSNVGAYPIAVTLGANPNYTVVATDATLTVTPKVLNVTVVADDQTKVYGDLNPALTAVVTGAVNGDTINYTLATTATQFSNVGAYPIAVTLGANPNYTVVATDATLTVTPREIDALADTNSAPVNGTTGGNSGVNVLTNDTLSGLPVNPADVVLSSTPNGPLTINPDGTVSVAPNTPAGTYTIDYTICEVLNPTNCDTATVTIVVAAPVIDAVADTNAIPVNGTTGGNSGVNVFTNDTLNGLPVNPADVVLSSTPNGPLTINPDGTVNVAPNTPAGTYTIDYTICQVLNPTNCDTATVTIVVAAPAIDAVADTNAIPVNGTTGGNSGVNVFTNDTLNGLPVNPADVVLSSTPNGPLTINPDGTVSVAPNTPAGTYTIDYTICQVLNPTNCDTATVTIVVAAPVIDAVADTNTIPVNGTTGGNSGVNVFTNDTLNGLPVNPADVVLSSTPNGPLTINPDGTVSVAPNTPAGTYTIDYTICQVFNPTNCDTATVTIVVAAPAIDAVADTFSNINCSSFGAIGNVLANDTLNGNPAKSEEVNITVISGGNPNITLDNLGNISVQSGIVSGSYVLTYQICEKLNPTNCDTATITINVQDATAPVIAQLPVASTISCGLTPNFAQALATDTCGSVNLTFVDVTVQGNCIGSYTITRTWTATDSSGNTATASQVISVQDNVGPTTTTAFTAIVSVNCDAIPAKPELVFVDNCSTVSPAIFTENIINRTENSYSVVRKWSVADACGNVSEFTQTINVTIPNSVVTINSSICNDGEITTTNLNDLLPMGTPTNGTWVDVNNSGGLQGSTLNAAGLSVRDYTFEYKINDATCPRTIRITMTVNTGCGGIVLACGTVLVHNAFSPNGDGINEKFIIDNIDDTVCYPENTVEIYNRWGVLVYETKGYNNTTNVFDGTSLGRTTVSQSTGLPTGTYFYILNYTSVDNDGKIMTNKKDGYLYIVNN